MRVFRLQVTAILIAGLVSAGNFVAAPVSASVVTVLSVLDQLRVATNSTQSYSRESFGGWIDADRNGCDTRAEVLISESVTPVSVGPGCALTGGSWFSYFDGVTWSNPSDVDIDHLVPLAEAWRSGAAAWTPAQRVAFANDLDFAPSLVAVTDSVNQSKGDRDPATWMPPAAGSHCKYATEWVLVKHRWRLAVDPAEKSALTGHLTGACGTSTVTLPTTAVPGGSVSPSPTPTPSAAPVYRFWSDTYNGHFYTISRTERDKLIQNFPESVWKYEGVAYGAYSQPQQGTVPLYRFWSAKHNGHFYTTSATERDRVIAGYPRDVWQYETVAYHVFPGSSTAAQTVSVSRFWSATYLHHFYTASATEAEKVKSTYPRHVWQYETVGFKVPSARPDAAPLPAPSTSPSRPANPGDTRNCGDFSTWAEANSWFRLYFPHYGDVARLDADGDGVPCESLPGAP